MRSEGGYACCAVDIGRDMRFVGVVLVFGGGGERGSDALVGEERCGWGREGRKLESTVGAADVLW